jgi:hypothetical protein
MSNFKVTHAQQRWDKPDDAPVETTIRVSGSEASGWQLNAPGLGCSRTIFRNTPENAIAYWLTAEHAQTVLAIDPEAAND